ncbi:CPBP family intramembrane glutamic endopeptidase [Calidifontibacillus erzurumensis]|uniref:CPBP family intramembrane glutamic endopeptidase n=1 Tax=Calidifontibacillus erzurumensis TaxID=2741433 RepID=UPI0035B55071
MFFAIILYALALITVAAKAPTYFIQDKQIANSIILAVYFLCLIVVLLIYRKELTKLYSFSRINKKSFLWAITGALTILVIQLINGMVMVLLNVELLPEGESFYDLANEFPVLLLLPLAAAPIFEELIFRGVIYEWSFKNTKGKHWIAAVCSSVLFAAIHFSLLNFVSFFLIGMVLAHLYRRYGLVLSTITHIFVNLAIISINLKL